MIAVARGLRCRIELQDLIGPRRMVNAPAPYIRPARLAVRGETMTPPPEPSPRLLRIGDHEVLDVEICTCSGSRGTSGLPSVFTVHHCTVGDDLGRVDALQGSGGNDIGGVGPVRKGPAETSQRLRLEFGLRGEPCRSRRRRARLHSTKMTYMIVIALSATTAATSGTTA